jgi:hypothetical protein
MHLGQRSATHERTFVSVKTAGPIPHGGGLVGDALVQATLDPDVRQIAFLGSARSSSAAVALNVITVVRYGAAFYLDIVPAGPLRSNAEHDAAERALAELGLSRLVLTGDDIMREPRFSTCRAVWAFRRSRVLPDMGFRLLTILENEGVMTLDDLCRQVPGPQDPFAAVLALACADKIALDLHSRPLGPGTSVSVRS